MSFNPDRLRHLFQQYIAKTATGAEVQELFAAITNREQKQYLTTLIDDEYKALAQADNADEIDWDHMFTRIMQQAANDKKVAPVLRLRWRRIAIAASVLLFVGLGAYFIISNRGGGEKSVQQTVAANDVPAPTTSRAIITLANGQQVYLDSVTSGQLAMQGEVNIVKTKDGKIIYEGDPSRIPDPASRIPDPASRIPHPGSPIAFNTLTNPSGSTVIDMQLSDGSRVWLNAGSSVTYPVAFIGNERKVSITGEAYFEVAASPSPSEGGGKRPFIVEKGDMRVTVLGTKFNVNAYDDEADIKVTLLEGRVRVLTTHDPIVPMAIGIGSRLLKPGQQARLTHDSRLTIPGSRLTIYDSPDLNQVMAWKNGQFVLKGTDVAALMRQIARWYDVDVVFTSKIPENKFGGSVSRDVNLSTVLQALKEYGMICRLEGRKVIIE